MDVLFEVDRDYSISIQAIQNVDLWHSLLVDAKNNLDLRIFELF